MTSWEAIIKNGDAKAVREHIAQGADVGEIDYMNKTALIYAAEKGDPEIVNRLIGKGADVNAEYKYYPMMDRISVLWEAVDRKRPDIVRLLLDAGAHPNSRGIEGTTALNDARERGYDKIVALIEAAQNGRREGE